MLQPLDPTVLSCLQLVATDVDGTLTRQGKFTPELLTALNDLAAVGLRVILVTGRSAGWVNGLAAYLPVVGAIAENGGLFYQGMNAELLSPIADLQLHRQQLAAVFAELQQRFPQIRETPDNGFRLTDWTFDVAGLSIDELREMGFGLGIYLQHGAVSYSTDAAGQGSGIRTGFATIFSRCCQSASGDDRR
jgi:predicted mannosyl-3-phosphoglycerate phosphatase (HAD superfamily)